MYPWTRPLCQLCLSETMFMKIIMKILLMKINSGQQQSPQPTLYSLTHVLENIFHLSLTNTVTVTLGSIHWRIGFNFGGQGSFSFVKKYEKFTFLLVLENACFCLWAGWCGCAGTEPDQGRGGTFHQNGASGAAWPSGLPHYHVIPRHFAGQQHTTVRRPHPGSSHIKTIYNEPRPTETYLMMNVIYHS